MKKITVIVPIYNVEKYLRTCFESLLKQDFADYEVLAVDDGSPDNSAAIMDEYASKYPDAIKVIHKENGGYGSVLEMAINSIDTPYFIICDPDDYLADDALKTLFNLASVSEADLTIGAKTFIYEGSNDQDYDLAYNKTFATLKPNIVYNKGTSEFEDLLFVDPSPHSKLYKTSIAKDIKFPHKVGYTDNLLFYYSLLSSNKVIYTDKSCAYYLVNRVGNTMTDVSPKALDAHILVFKEILKQTEKLNAPDMFYYRMFESYKFILHQARHIKGTKDDYREKLNNLYSYVEMLVPHRQAIIPNYDKYAKTRFLEKIRDHRLLNPSTSKKTYEQLVNKLVNTFENK